MLPLRQMVSEFLPPYLFKDNTESSSSHFHMASEASRLAGDRSDNRHMQKVKMALSPHQVTKKDEWSIVTGHGSEAERWCGGKKFKKEESTAQAVLCLSEGRRGRNSTTVFTSLQTNFMGICCELSSAFVCF